MNKQQKPKRSPIRPDYLVIVIIILLAIGMYFFFTQMMAPGVKEYDEFEFIAAIEAGEIATMRTEYVGGDNFNLWEVAGTFSEGNAPEGVGSYVIILYGDRLNNIQDLVLTYNEANPSTPITISFVPHVTIDFWNILTTVLLIAGPIILVIFMFRSMSSQSNKAQDFTK